MASPWCCNSLELLDILSFLVENQVFSRKLLKNSHNMKTSNFYEDILSFIWIKSPLPTDRDYLKDTNNAGYLFRWTNSGRSTNQMIGFRIFQIVVIRRSKGP
jgi:hypothetical protein